MKVRFITVLWGREANLVNAADWKSAEVGPKPTPSTFKKILKKGGKNSEKIIETKTEIQKTEIVKRL